MHTQELQFLLARGHMCRGRGGYWEGAPGGVGLTCSSGQTTCFSVKAQSSAVDACTQQRARPERASGGDNGQHLPLHADPSKTASTGSQGNCKDHGVDASLPLMIWYWTSLPAAALNLRFPFCGRWLISPT